MTSRPKTIAILIALVVLGLSIEGLKNFRDLSADKAERSKFSLGDLDVRPFRVSHEDMEANRARLKGHMGSRGGFKLAGRPQLSEQYDFSEGHKVASGVKEGETQKKKKSKKKKKSARGKGKGKDKEVDTESDEDLADEESDEDQDGFDNGEAKSEVFVSQFQEPKKEDEKLPITFEDWAKLILGQPRPENVDKLVSFYKNNLVTGEVFYALLTAMMEENNSKQHELALSAANRVPTSRSFIFFIDVLKTERQGSTLAAKISGYLKNYQTLAHVFHLKDILTAHVQDPTLTQFAVQTLDESTKRYLEGRTPSAVGGDENGGGAAATDSTSSTAENSDTLERQKARALKVYSGFVPLLENVLVQYAGHRSIVEPAQRTLSRIQNLTVVLAELNR